MLRNMTRYDARFDSNVCVNVIRPPSKVFQIVPFHLLNFISFRNFWWRHDFASKILLHQESKDTQFYFGYKWWVMSWSTLVEGGKEWYRPPGKLTLELVLANQKQNKLLCLWTMQLTKWAGKVPYLLLLKCSIVMHITLIKSLCLTWR